MYRVSQNFSDVLKIKCIEDVEFKDLLATPQIPLKLSNNVLYSQKGLRVSKGTFILNQLHGCQNCTEKSHAGLKKL